MMIEAFYVTALIVISRVPPDGWIQWTRSYATKTACEAVIRKDYVLIGEAIKSFMGKELKVIKEMRCMTHKQAVKLNSQLGH
jgi:hypothetical protein